MLLLQRPECGQAATSAMAAAEKPPEAKPVVRWLDALKERLSSGWLSREGTRHIPGKGVQHEIYFDPETYGEMQALAQRTGKELAEIHFYAIWSYLESKNRELDAAKELQAKKHKGTTKIGKAQERAIRLSVVWCHYFLITGLCKRV